MSVRLTDIRSDYFTYVFDAAGFSNVHTQFALVSLSSIITYAY